MSQHTPHELHDEFPADADLLHRLKMEDAHFQKLAESYHTVNREIHRIEAEVEAASDERAEQLKKQRLALLDDIAAVLDKHRAPTA